MSYASLHEAYTPYSENLSEPSETSNPELLNRPPARRSGGIRDGPAMLGGAGPSPDIDLPRGIPVVASRQDPVAAFGALQLANEVRVPGNQTAVSSPEQLFHVKQPLPPSLEEEARHDREVARRRKAMVGGADGDEADQEAAAIAQDEGSGNFKCGDDHDCMNMINHILDCPSCAEKLRKIMSLGGGGGMGLDLDSKHLSQILFYFIIALIIIAVYELLNSLFRKLRN